MARTVIEIKVPVRPSEIAVSAVEAGATAPPETITQDEYFRRLSAAAGPKVVDFVREVLAEAPDHGLRVDWMKAGPVLKYDYEAADTFFNFGGLRHTGKLAERGDLFVRFRELNLPLEICRDYMDEVARLVPGASRQIFSSGRPFDSEILLYGDHPGREDYVPLEKLIPVKELWLSAIDKVIRRINEAREGE